MLTLDFHQMAGLLILHHVLIFKKGHLLQPQHKPSQLSNIMALRPVEFDFKGYEPGEGHQIGFIAQDVQLVYPDVVGEGTDGMLTLSDMNKNDARLIKCIQEQQALILALTDRIAALETK